MSSLPLPPVKSSKLSVMVVLSRFVSSFSSLSLFFSPLSFFLRGALLHLHGGRASAPPRLFSFLFCKPSLSFFPRPRPPLLDQWRSARLPSSPPPPRSSATAFQTAAARSGKAVRVHFFRAAVASLPAGFFLFFPRPWRIFLGRKTTDGAGTKKNGGVDLGC